MITETDLKDIPGIEFQPPDGSETIGFRIPTTVEDAGKTTKIWVEIRCPDIRGRLFLTRAEVYRPGGGRLPESWAAKNLEKMLKGIIDLSRKMNARKGNVVADVEAKKAIKTVQTQLAEAAVTYLGDKDPLEVVNDWVALTMQSFTHAVKARAKSKTNPVLHE